MNWMEKAKQKTFDWRCRTNNLGETYYERNSTRHAQAHMAHKPYGHYDEMVNTAEPERDTGWE